MTGRDGTANPVTDGPVGFVEEGLINGAGVFRPVDDRGAHSIGDQVNDIADGVAFGIDMIHDIVLPIQAGIAGDFESLIPIK